MQIPDPQVGHREGHEGNPGFPVASSHQQGTGHSGAPPQGRRLQTETTTTFPSPDIVGVPPFRDVGGDPIYVGSAVFPNSSAVHPCKLAPALSPPCRVAYGGAEYEHSGRYDLLPITPEMEWVPTGYGRIPQGRKPIDGGFEETGERLFHAVAVVEGVSVPGKTAVHLRAANVAFGGAEIQVEDGYWILCWRE